MSILSPTAILNQLQLYLPRYTDLFSEFIDVIAAEVVSSDTVRIETATAHGLIVPNVLNVTQGLLQNSIIAVEFIFDDTIARFATADPHDFVSPQQVNDVTILEMAGFTDSVWNNKFAFSIPDKTHFDVFVPDGASIPVLTGSEILFENRPAGILGAWLITAVGSTTEFDFKVTNRPDLPINPITDIKVTARSRMFIAANVKKAQDSYAEHEAEEASLYLIMTSAEVSKDRRAKGDEIALFSKGDSARLEILYNFSTVIFLNTSNTLRGSTAVQTSFDLWPALLRTLFLFQQDNSVIKTITAGHGQGIYNSAVYSHVFDWQLPAYIDESFGFSDPQDVALRNIDMSFAPAIDGEFSELAILTANINYDN